VDGGALDGAARVSEITEHQAALIRAMREISTAAAPWLGAAAPAARPAQPFVPAIEDEFLAPLAALAEAGSHHRLHGEAVRAVKADPTLRSILSAGGTTRTFGAGLMGGGSDIDAQTLALRLVQAAIAELTVTGRGPTGAYRGPRPLLGRRWAMYTSDTVATSRREPDLP